MITCGIVLAITAITLMILMVATEVPAWVYFVLAIVYIVGESIALHYECLNNQKIEQLERRINELESRM